MGGTFVKLHELPYESDSSTSCGSGSVGSSEALTWENTLTGDNTATPERVTFSEDASLQDDSAGDNTATPMDALLSGEEGEVNVLFQAYVSPRTFHADWPPEVEDAIETDDEWEEMMDMLSFHTSVFGSEKLSEEVLAYHEAFGRFPTFEALFVNDWLDESSFHYRAHNWGREAFVASVRLFLEPVIDRSEFSAIAFVQEIPTPYEQGGNDHIFIIAERSYAPLRVMICVVITFDLDDGPEIHALSVPQSQYIWSKDLVRDLQMEGVCRDPRFECSLRHGLLEMPTIVAWQPYQGMKLNLDIKMLPCGRHPDRLHIMASQVDITHVTQESPPDDGVSFMQQDRIVEGESDWPITLSTQRDDTESLCNGYTSRGPTDIVPHFVNQAQHLEDLREWLLALLGRDDSITLYVLSALKKMSQRIEFLSGQRFYADSLALRTGSEGNLLLCGMYTRGFFHFCRLRLRISALLFCCPELLDWMSQFCWRLMMDKTPGGRST